MSQDSDRETDLTWEEGGTRRKYYSRQVHSPKSKLSRSSGFYQFVYQFVYVIMTLVQLGLLVLYLVAGGIMTLFGLAAVGGGGATKIEAIIQVVSIWVIVLGCASLFLWLHFAKKQRGIALLVILLPLVIFLFLMFVTS